jgi:hypothetical protein
VTALGISREKSLGYAVQEVKSVELQTRPTNPSVPCLEKLQDFK